VRVFYNRVVSKVFRHKRTEVTGTGEEYIKRNFTITPYQILWGDKNKKNETGGTCSTYGGEIHIGFWWGNLREREHLED
jgi:hypothetical protein